MNELTEYLDQKSEIERLNKQVKGLSLELISARNKLSELVIPSTRNKEFLTALLISKKTGNLDITIEEIAEKCGHSYYSVRHYSRKLKVKGCNNE